MPGTRHHTSGKTGGLFFEPLKAVSWNGFRAPSKGALPCLHVEDPQLIELTVSRFLFPDVLPHRLLILSYRGHVVPPGPEALPSVVPSPPDEHPSDVDRALPFQEPHHSGDGVFR